MKKMIWVVVAVTVLVAMAVLTGCPKKEQAELQGAPPVPPPPPATHTMPNGQPMSGEAMKSMPGPSNVQSAATTPDTASCPVLGTTMTKKDMIRYDYKGKTYYFCCADCVTKFKANPEKYIKNPAKPLPLGAPMPMGS